MCKHVFEFQIKPIKTCKIYFIDFISLEFISLEMENKHANHFALLFAMKYFSSPEVSKRNSFVLVPFLRERYKPCMPEAEVEM